MVTDSRVAMGEIPATAQMVSTVITNPKNLDTIPEKTTFTISVNIANMALGSFTNATSTYYTAPQQLDGQGRIIGHTHVTVQDTGSTLNPTQPLDGEKFAFFKGINDAGNGNGLLTTEVTGGLPAGNYRVCSMAGASNHQPVLMAVAQRGAQDDCKYFTVTAGGNAGNGNNAGNNAGATNNAAAGGNGKGNGKGNGAAAGAASSAASSSAAAASTSAAAAGGNGGGRGGKGKGNGAAAGAADAAASAASSSAAAATTSAAAAAGGKGNGKGKGNGAANNAAAATSSAADAAATSAAAAAGGKGNGKGKGNGAGAANNAAAATTSAAAAAATSAAAGNAGGKGGKGATRANNAATGDATAAGAIGGIAAPAVENVGGARPFSVNGDTFVNEAAAKQRACAVQNNQCANAVNSGKVAGQTVQDCNAQEVACNAA